MSILKIAKIGHPILIKKAKEINDLGSEKIKKLVYDMTETMLDADGVGLAAPQVHIDKRIFIYRNPEVENEDKININVIINPKIKILGQETNDSWEGCLSIPGILGLVRRFVKIEYSGYDLEGKPISNIAEGMQARIIQHEYDHLDGILYTSKLAHKNAIGFSEEIEKFWKKNEK